MPDVAKRESLYTWQALQIWLGRLYKTLCHALALCMRNLRGFGDMSTFPVGHKVQHITTAMLLWLSCAVVWLQILPFDTCICTVLYHPSMNVALFPVSLWSFQHETGDEATIKLYVNFATSSVICMTAVPLVGTVIIWFKHTSCSHYMHSTPSSHLQRFKNARVHLLWFQWCLSFAICTK